MSSCIIIGNVTPKASSPNNDLHGFLVRHVFLCYLMEQASHPPHTTGQNLHYSVQFRDILLYWLCALEGWGHWKMNMAGFLQAFLVFFEQWTPWESESYATTHRHELTSLHCVHTNIFAHDFDFGSVVPKVFNGIVSHSMDSIIFQSWWLLLLTILAMKNAPVCH